jgi:von Willebrand factor type A domain
MTKALVRLLACLPLFLADTWAQGLDVMFVLDTSPDTEQQIGLIRPHDLKENDRAGVIGFARSVQLLQPLTYDRQDLAKALQRAGTRISIGVHFQPIPGGYVDISGALRQAISEFGDRSRDEARKRLIVALVASADPGLAGDLESLNALLAASEVRLFAVAITLVSGRAYSSPGITAEFLNQLAKSSGGRVFRGGWDLKSILAMARKP